MPSTDHFSEDDYEFLKFHGVYQQDDRDKRKTGKQYIMMVRTRFPGGVLTGKQYVACDDFLRSTATTRCASPRGRISSFTES